jgi:hypothetical protein
MNATEAQRYGRKTRQHARDLAEMGDIAPGVAQDCEWWIAERSHRLGIVGADGVIDLTGETANAFRKGWRGR